MLKKLRVVIALVVFGGITLYFLDFAGLIPQVCQKLVQIQFIPALLSISLFIVAGIVITTLLFGRIYCAVFCPAGVLQDVVGRVARLFRKKRKKFKYTPPHNLLRWTILGVVTLCTLLGFPLLLSLLDPYGIYGRIATNLFRPLYLASNNLLASVLSHFGNYSLYQQEIYIQGTFVLIVAVISLLGIGLMAWKYGRDYCNTICPVGTLLGWISKYSLFKIRIDTDRCNGCGICASRCKASCINPKEHTVDYSRCVACFNCIGSCKQEAVRIPAGSFKAFNRPQTVTRLATATKTAHEGTALRSETSTGRTNPDATPATTTASLLSRRKFLGTLLGSAVLAPVAWADPTSGETLRKHLNGRKAPITPPGARSTEHLLKHCTACQLCVSKCPSRVIRPTELQYGIRGMLMPEMNFEKGFCNYDCTLCTEICPAGALRPLSVDEKHLTQIGYVVFNQEHCIVFRDHTSCGACSEHCPTQAVTMVPYLEGEFQGLTLPEIHPEICVGCGGCESVCPSLPQRAIYVEGNPVHHPAKPILKEVQQKVQVEDFGF